jgi:hypothetical protein
MLRLGSLLASSVAETELIATGYVKDFRDRINGEDKQERGEGVFLAETIQLRRGFA